MRNKGFYGILIVLAIVMISLLVMTFNLSNKYQQKSVDYNNLMSQHQTDSTEIANLSRLNDEKLLRITGLLDSLYRISAQLEKSQTVISWLKRDIKKLETTRDSLLAVNEQSQSRVKLLTIQSANLADSTAALEKGLLEQNANWQAKYDTLSFGYLNIRSWAECEHNRGWLKRLFSAGKCLIP